MQSIDRSSHSPYYVSLHPIVSCPHDKTLCTRKHQEVFQNRCLAPTTRHMTLCSCHLQFAEKDKNYYSNFSSLLSTVVWVMGGTSGLWKLVPGSQKVIHWNKCRKRINGGTSWHWFYQKKAIKTVHGCEYVIKWNCKQNRCLILQA